MMEVTFDTNLLIDLEEKREGHENVQKILDLHNGRQIKVCIPAIAASEKLLDEKHIPNYKLFEEYLTKLKIMNHVELMPLMYLSMCYLDHAHLSGKKLSELDHQIHKILFPNIEPEHKEFCKARNLQIKGIHPKWRNAKIDVQMLWCHIHHKKDIFITRDENFKKKNNELNEQIGKIEIMNPFEFLENFKELVE